ncbi:hypothetical protein NMY22_g7553 [Coprinellus aureogranulatus]|nr:hypothetical protein NMY22_g7553 [Coprinellus aureogranulatus]
MSLPTYRELWKRLYDSTQTFLAKTKTVTCAVHLPDAPPQRETSPPLDLTVPPDFFDLLHGLQLPSSALQVALTRVHQAVDEQRVLHEKKYQEVCAKFIQLYEPSTSSRHSNYYQSIKKSHENSFQRQLIRIREAVLKVYEDIQIDKPEKKPVFNSEYTPVLEQYFEYNSFPSAKDRELLARKSSMTVRQIEVWFQNHRRRARKEGRHLRRISNHPLPAELSLDTLKEQMPSFMLRKEERCSPSLGECAPPMPTQRSPSPATTHDRTPSMPAYSLDTIPNSSSWPAEYSARDGATFFSTCRWPNFPEPVWYRKPSNHSASSRSPQSPSINELCSELISKLHLGGAGSMRMKPLGRSVATRKQFVATGVPSLASPPAIKSTRTPSGVTNSMVKFGCTSSLRSGKGHQRHQPYDRSLRKYPSWSLSNSKSDPTPARLHMRQKSSIPRTPSLASVSSSESFYSDPPTPRDSPNSSPVRPLPSIDSFDETYFDFSADTISSYPSSTERYTPYTKLSPSHSSIPSYPASSAY